MTVIGRSMHSFLFLYFFGYSWLYQLVDGIHRLIGGWVSSPGLGAAAPPQDARALREEKSFSNSPMDIDEILIGN